MTAADAKQLMKTLTTQVEFRGSRDDAHGLRLDYSDSWALVQKAASGTGLTVRLKEMTKAMSRAQSVLRTSIRDAMPSLELPF